MVKSAVLKFQSMNQVQKVQSRQQPLETGANFKHLSHKNVQRPQTQIAVSRHNEYNNNEEDYSKATKEDLIQNLFNKRKQK